MATRYAVGTGTWDNSNTGIWSTTSGGSTGASVPTSTDDVVFDANTGDITLSGNYPIGGPECSNFDVTSGYTGTFAVAGADLSIYGTSCTLGASMTITGYTTGAFLFTTGSTVYIDGANQLMPILALGYTAAGNTYYFSDYSTCYPHRIRIEGGTMQVGTDANIIVTEDVRITGSNGGTFGITASSGDLKYSGQWLCDAAATISHTGTATISAELGATLFDGGGKTYNKLLIAAYGGLVTIQDANTFDKIGIFYENSAVVFPASTTTTITTKLELPADYFQQQGYCFTIPQIYSSTVNTTATISFGATQNLTHLYVKDITVSGSTVNLDRYRSGGNISGFTLGPNVCTNTEIWVKHNPSSSGLYFSYQISNFNGLAKSDIVTINHN